MRRITWAGVLALLASVPAVSVGQKFQPGPGPGLPPPGGVIFSQAMPAYTPPKADGSVVELLDEGIDSLGPQLINDGGNEAGTISREDRDVFAGVESARVTPMQKYASRIPGWNFQIVEKPAKAGEFRYLRFAWKKAGGVGIMIQFHDPAKTWGFRYYSGQNVQGWQPATQVSDKLPGEWTVVTRDLFKEFGAFTITGFALTPYDGQSALFDHMLLGRTVEDLDKATDAALGKVKPAAALVGKERDGLWADLIGADAKKAAPALRAFLAAAPDQVGYVRERLGKPIEKDNAVDLRKLIADLDADTFDTRVAAAENLIKAGAPAIDPVREALRAAPNDEVRFRCRVILKALGVGPAAATGPVALSGRMSRVVRVLERAGNADARVLLAEIADGKLAPEVASDAKAALARLPKTP